MLFKKKKELSTTLWNTYLDFLDKEKSKKMQELIGQLQVWLKAKGLYKQALDDIENLKYFDIKYLIIGKKGIKK